MGYNKKKLTFVFKLYYDEIKYGEGMQISPLSTPSQFMYRFNTIT